jgi:endonuclease YncB( thermonuclease family)
MRVLIAVFFCIVIGPSWAEEATITNGATVMLSGIPYRLDGIDAPQTDQICLDEKRNAWACGLEARDQLRKFVGKRDVRCDKKGHGTVYRNRRIAVCWVEGETTSLNQWLVREGWALNFEPDAKGRFKADEDDARSRGSGIWKGCFSRPQEARRSNKSKASLLGASCPPSKEVRDILFPDKLAMPRGCPIKAQSAVRADVAGHRGIYHMEGCRSYGRTKTPDRWFCSEDEAKAEGFRKAFSC